MGLAPVGHRRQFRKTWGRGIGNRNSFAGGIRQRDAGITATPFFAGGIWDDHTQNGHTLTPSGTEVATGEPFPKYGVGQWWDPLTATDLAENIDDATWDHNQDLALAMVFRFSNLSAFQYIIGTGRDSGSAFGWILNKDSGSGGELEFRQQETGPTSETFIIPWSQDTNWHILTLRRVAATERLVVKIDGTTALDQTGFTNPLLDLSGTGRRLWIGERRNVAGNDWEGAFTELRIWNGNLPSQGQLDTWANSGARGEANYEQALIGGETAAYALEAIT